MRLFLFIYCVCSSYGGPTLMFCARRVRSICATECWSSSLSLLSAGSISARYASRTNKQIHKAGTIIGQNLELSESLSDRRSLKKLHVDNPPHPLHSTQQRQQTSNLLLSHTYLSYMLFPGLILPVALLKAACETPSDQRSSESKKC